MPIEGGICLLCSLSMSLAELEILSFKLASVAWLDKHCLIEAHLHSFGMLIFEVCKSYQSCHWFKSAIPWCADLANFM